MDNYSDLGLEASPFSPNYGLRRTPIVKVELICAGARYPEYAHDTDSGADLFSTETVVIPSGNTAVIGTGIKIELPAGWEAQVRSKSGRAAKESLFVLNSPGTVDNGYRGEVKVIIHNASHSPQRITAGEKIAQLVIAPYFQASFVPVGEVNVTDRGEGGFGSTGIKGDETTLYTFPPRQPEPDWSQMERLPVSPVKTVLLSTADNGYVPSGNPFAPDGTYSEDGRQIERRPD